MADSNIISVDFGTGAPEFAGDTGYDYDRQCDLMREKNQHYLDLFETDMCNHGLAESTIRRHLDNVDFYINEYLLYYGVNDMEFGCYDIGGFLGDFFIRKCMWSTPGTIKTNATSIKKFYKCMRDNGLVTTDAYDRLLRTIKENMADWQADCAEFNNPAYDPFFDDGNFEELLLDLYRKELARGLGIGQDKLDALLPGDGSKRDASFDSATGADPRIATSTATGASAATSTSTTTGTSATAYAPIAPPSREEVIDALTLTLFYLTSWEERVGGKNGFMLRKAWKSADRDALDRLRDVGLVDCTNKAKSVTLTDEGAAEARLFLLALDLGHLLDS